MRLARFLGGVGRTLITAGVLILLFVAYQLWGTGIREAQAQDRLGNEFEERLDEARDRAPATTSTTTPEDTTTEPEQAPPIGLAADGEATAQIRIPRIGVDKTVVEGVSLANLKQGPGRYPETAMPGQEGNAAIAGHRTTYGAPFNRIDELEPGDEILVETVQGQFRYEVSEQLIVSPSQVEVLEDKGDNRLTLTACHPKFSARQRIIVVALLAPDQQPLPFVASAAPDRPAPPTTLDDIDGERHTIVPTVLLALLCAAIWLLAWLIGRRWRKWPSLALGFPFFMVALFFFFEEFSRLLPSSF
jgi:sortase A